MKKIIALIMALALVMGLAITASAEENTGYAITIDVPAGVESVTYKVYKVFDAVPGAGDAISYSLVEGKTTAPAGFTVDAVGNVTYSGTSTNGELTPADIAAIKQYVGESDVVYTVTATNDTTVTAYVPSAGYYYVNTSSGSVVAIYSAKPTATVTDKNDAPSLVKKVNGETTATVDNYGTVTFTIEVQIPEKLHNSLGEQYVLIVHDNAQGVMTSRDHTVTVEGNTVIPKMHNNTYDGCQLELRFSYDDIKNYAGKKMVITYTGTIDALAKDATNTAWVTYNGYKGPESTVTISNASVSIFKYTGENQPLPGAGFVLAKKDAQGNITEYYKIDTSKKVTWVTNIDEATEHKSGADGNVPAFEGLAEGTYYIVEKTVPAGYNKALDTEVTIGTAANTAGIKVAQDVSADVVNNTGSQLPSTGGIGTTLFYVIGGLMMTGAAVLLITKKRMAA